MKDPVGKDKRKAEKPLKKRPDKLADAAFMGRVMAYAFTAELDLVEQATETDETFKELITEAASSWVELVRTGPTAEFNQAQSNLTLICDLYEWWKTWLLKKASSTKK